MTDPLAQALAANNLSPELFQSPSGDETVLPLTQQQAMQLAAEQWIFCDDIVGQGTQSVRSLAISLWQSKTWFFLWD